MTPKKRLNLTQNPLVLYKWSHPFVERLIGTVRGEYLDQVLFWNTTDLTMNILRRLFGREKTETGERPSRHVLEWCLIQAIVSSPRTSRKHHGELHLLSAVE